MQKFLLAHHRSPGDIVVMTALPRDIHLQYPGQFQIGVKTSCKSLWENNPYIVPLNEKDKSVHTISLDYGEGIKKQRQETVHFLQYFHRDFTKKTGIQVQLQRPYGDLHLTDAEIEQYRPQHRYWILNAGGKSDATVKVWGQEQAQQLVDRLRRHGIIVLQVGARDKDHWHPKLAGVIDLVGKTNLRQLLAIIANADGVISGVTAVMHMAAALHRPCVVIAGGREAWYWEAYVPENTGFGQSIDSPVKVPHRFLHTIGLLDCCQYSGCWKNKVVPAGKDRLVCLKPVKQKTQTIPRCMAMVTPHAVETAVLSYYYDGTLPAITDTLLSQDVKGLWNDGISR